MAKGPSYLKAAFLMPANLIGLLAAGIGSAVTDDPTPMLVALGAEAVYLGLMSSSRVFKRAVRAAMGPIEAEVGGRKEIDALLQDLAPSQRQHYVALCELKDKILANYRRLPGGRVMVAASEQRVDALLTQFLRLLATLNAYRKYLSGTDRKAIEAELLQLKAEAAAETNVRLKEVKEKRAEILQKRVQRFQQAEESREVVSHQLASIEDLLRLTHEQSIAIRDPDSIGKQLDLLTAEVKETEDTVREMERFMELDEAIAPPLSHGNRVRT